MISLTTSQKTADRGKRRAVRLKKKADSISMPEQHVVKQIERLDLDYMSHNDPPPIPWVIEGFAAKGELTMLFGAGGMAKSLFLQALANGVERGEDVAGFKVYQGHCMNFDSENGKRELWRRVHKLTLTPTLTVFLVNSLNLLDEDDRELVKEKIEDEQPDLVVFDSLRRLSLGAEENDSGTMADVLSNIQWMCQEQDFAGVMIHHADKLGRTFRGSSAIRDQVSMSFKLGRIDNDEDKWRRYIETDKYRLGDEPDTRWFRISDIHGGLADVGKVRIEETEAGNDSVKAIARQTTKDLILKLFDPPVGPLGKHKLSANGNGHKRLSEIAAGLEQDPKNRTLRMALNALIEDGFLGKGDDKRYYRLFPEEE